jgi:hypothetical protein
MTLPFVKHKPALLSPVTLSITAPGSYTLNAGTDYNVVISGGVMNGRIRLAGGRRVYVSGGTALAAGHTGFEINVASTPSTPNCLQFSGTELEAWVDGGYIHCTLGLDVDGIALTSSTADLYILNTRVDGTGRNAVNVTSAIGTLYCHGFTFRTFGRGIAPDIVIGGTGSWSGMNLDRVSGHWGTGAARTDGRLLYLRADCAATAVPGNILNTWLQDDAAPTAAIAAMVTPSSGTCAPIPDAAGNLVFQIPAAMSGVVWKGEPAGGDWVLEAETGLNYVHPGYLADQAVTPDPANPLFISPNASFIALTSPTTTNVGSGGGTVTLGSGDHRRITLNSGTAAVNGNVTINGVASSGNRVHIIGGQINRAFEDATAASHCLRLNNVARVLIEGVRFDKQNTAGDCISINGSWEVVVILNCLGVGINYRDTSRGHAFTQHGDFVQIQTAGGLIIMDLASFYSWSQGILTNSSLGTPTLSCGGVLKRVNGHAYDTSLNPIPNPDPTHPLLYLQDDCSLTPIPWWLDRVWVVDDQAASPSTLPQLVQPSVAFGGAAMAACGANHDTSANTLSWPQSTKITGLVRYGVPDSAITGSMAGSLPRVTTAISGVHTAPPDPGGAYYRPYAGTGYSALTIGNLQIGRPSGRQISKRIVVPKTGSIRYFTWYAVLPDNGEACTSCGGGVYGWGTGGTIRTSIQTNSGTSFGGGVPSGSIIGGSSNYFQDVHLREQYPNHETGARSVFQTGQFPTDVPVTAGQIIHVVHVNVDPDDDLNFVSTDDLWTDGTAAFHPIITNRILIRTGSSAAWGVSSTRHYYPVYELGYSNGEKYGNPYINGARPNTTTDNHSSHQVVNATTWVRQTMVPYWTFTATHVSLWGRPVNNSGTFICEVRNSSNTVLRSATMTAGNYWGTGERAWLTEAAFSSPITLTAGTRYNITFRGTGSAQITTRGMKDGTVSEDGWAGQTNRVPAWSPELGLGGRAEYSTNSGGTWVGFTDSGATNASSNDLAFYFRTDEA